MLRKCSRSFSSPWPGERLGRTHHVVAVKTDDYLLPSLSYPLLERQRAHGDSHRRPSLHSPPLRRMPLPMIMRGLSLADLRPEPVPADLAPAEAAEDRATVAAAGQVAVGCEHALGEAHEAHVAQVEPCPGAGDRVAHEVARRQEGGLEFGFGTAIAAREGSMNRRHHLG